MKNFSFFNFQNKKVIIRVDFNVPLNTELKITDDTRISSAIPTIKKILDDGGAVILMSHLGRPKSGPENKFSLIHIQQHLQILLNQAQLKHSCNVKFVGDCIGDKVKNEVKNLDYGDVLLLENLRFHKEEEKGDLHFAKQLSELADFYVNDAFGTAHRAHASTAIIAQYFSKENKSFGYLMEAEVTNAEKILLKSENPFTAIIGGAKVSDKILIIENLLNKANNLIIGGGMAYTFLKAQGFGVGNSLVEEDKLELALNLIRKAKNNDVNLLLPIDHIIADKFANDAKTKTVTNAEGVDSGWMGLDIGNKSVEQFKSIILKSKTILWNGPMGVFEMPTFQNGTRSVAEAIAEATVSNKAFSLIGGGDSVAAINQFKLHDKVSFISTGGGALLELFEGKILPGISAIKS